MKRKRWVFGAVAVAGVLSLVAPAVGQGKAQSASLSWSRSHGGAALMSYDFGAVDGGARIVKGFRLGNSSLTKSGQLAITVTGSSRFSIATDRCTGKSVGRKLSCWVGVAYRPLGDPGSDSATLRATGTHGAVASLSLSGSDADSTGHIYWTDGGLGTVNSVPIDGGSVTALAFGQNSPHGVAVDRTHVYWTNAGTSGEGVDGSVNEAPIGGGGAVTTLASGQIAPLSVAVDGRHVYWANSSAGTDLPGTVNEVPIDGGSVTTLASGEAYPWSVAVDGADVYWVNFGGNGAVKKVPVGGGGVTTLAIRQGASLVAVDGTHIYWANDRSVREMPLAGGSVTTLAIAQSAITAIAVDNTHVYWVTLGTGDHTGKVKKVPLGGGSVTTLATGQRDPEAVAVDGTHVYWVNFNGSVNEVSIDGGRVTTLVGAQEGSAALSIAVGP